MVYIIESTKLDENLFETLIKLMSATNEMIILHTCITHNIYLCFSITLALVGGFSSCFGDAILNTQVYSIFGQHYREKSTEAYALYKFIKVHDHVRTLVFSATCCIKHLRLLVLIW